MWMRVAFIGLATILVAAACSAPLQAPGAAPGSQSSASSPQSQPTRRITAAIRGIPTSMVETRTLFSVTNIPGLEAIDELVHAGLTQADNQGVRRPRLAEAVPTLENGLWTVFPDGRMETTWRIRPGARWHDEAPITSADLLFAVTVEQDKELALPRPAPYELIESVEAPAPDTVTIKWKQPFIEADGFFSGEMTSPMPRHLLERIFTEDKANFLAAPYWTTEFVGAGPFKLREWALGSYVVLVANDGYVLGRPKVDEVEVRFIQDQSALIASLMAGAVELTMGRTLITPEQGLQVGERRGGDVRIVWGSNSWYRLAAQFINTHPPIVGDVRFRRALLHGLDRQQMADTLMEGLALVAHSYVDPDAPEYKEIEPYIIRYDYDPRRAAQLIDEMGYRRGAEGLYHDAAGQKLSITIWTTTRAEMNPKVTIAVNDGWRQMGVDAEPVMIPAQRINDREHRATFPAFEMIRGSNSVTSRDMKRLHSASTPLPENRFQITGNNPRYRNADLDSFLDRYVATIPRRERMETLGQIVRHLTEHLPWMGLFYDVEPTVIASRLERATGKGSMGSQAWNAHEWEVRR